MELLGSASKAYAACWLLIVVHTWLSVRLAGFAVPAGIAFAALLAGSLLLNASPDIFGWWYPWTLPIGVRPEGLYDAHRTLAPALFGAAAGLALAAPGLLFVLELLTMFSRGPINATDPARLWRDLLSFGWCCGWGCSRRR